LDGSNGSTFTTPSGFSVGPSAQSAGNESIYAFYEAVGPGATGTASSTIGVSTNWVAASLLIAGPATPYAPPFSPRSFVPQVRASNWRGWTKRLSGLAVPGFADTRLVF
jgi:hypothetical protein